MKPLISLVVPVFNEAVSIEKNLKVILEAAKGNWYELELIAVDDGSRDSTADEVVSIAKQDARVRLLSFTRNFGKEAAILAGLKEAKGAAAVVLDSDLQHPPELIPKMLEFWRQGLFVVEAVKENRGQEAVHDGMFARGFYTVFRRFTGLDIDGHSDYKLLDRVVIDAYLAFPERERFFRGLIGWAKYPSAQIPFSVPERAGGTSQWGKLKLLRYAINNITSFSSAPLKLVSVLGLVTFAFGIIIGLNSILQKIEGRAISGFTTVNLLIIIIGGAILMGLGIIGHYIARLYEEIKGRPTYLIKPSKHVQDE